MARSALETARNLLGFAWVLVLAPAAVSAQDEAIVRVNATVIAPEFLAPQMSAVREGASIVEHVRSADQGTDRAAAEAGHGVMVSFAVVADEPSDEGRAPQLEAQSADWGMQRVVRVTVAYASN
jgi:hypothetical protein